MMNLQRATSIGLLVLAIGCDGEGIDTVAETTDASIHALTTTSVAYAKGVASLFVVEDPTLDVTKTAEQNADAIAAQAAAALPGAALTHTAGTATLTLNFDGISAVANLGVLAGSVAVTVSRAATSLTVNFMFTGLTVKGMVLEGSLVLATTNGTTFSVNVDLTGGGRHVIYNGKAIPDAAGAGITLDGTGTSQSGDGPLVSYSMVAVHHAWQQCYADGGTLTMNKNVVGKRGGMVAVAEQVRFDANTPTTGKVAMTINGVGSTMTLPPYGSCPHS
jgi:hypothetical protein